MKLVAHLVRADLRQFRWIIALWCAIVVGETIGTGVRARFVTDVMMDARAGLVVDLLWYALQLGTIVLVPIVMHAHPAVSSDAFWMTRPIPGRTMFAAKLVLLTLLLIAIPAATKLALMLAIRVPGKEALFVTAETVLSGLAWLAVLMAGAAVTLNLARFALLCGGVVVSFAIFLSVLIMRMRTHEEGAVVVSLGVPSTLPPTEDATAALLFLLCIIAAGLGTAAIQYRTRLRRVSVPAGIAAILVAAFGLRYWSVPLLATPTALPEWAMASDKVELGAPRIIQMMPAMPWMEGPMALRSGATPVSVMGVASGWVPRLELLDAELHIHGGPVLRSRGRGFQSTANLEDIIDDPSRVVAREILGVGRVLTPTVGPIERSATTLVLPTSEIDPLLPATGDYRGHFAVHLTHWEPAAVLSLQRGAVFEEDAYRLRIERVVEGPDASLLVRATESRASSMFDRKPPVEYGFYVRNEAQGAAMAGTPSPIGGASALGFFGFSSATAARFFTRGTTIMFLPDRGMQEPFAWDPTWYADADLVVVRMTDAGAVVRTLGLLQVKATVKRK